MYNISHIDIALLRDTLHIDKHGGMCLCLYHPPPQVMSYAQQRVVSQHSMLVVSADHLIDTSDSESLLLNKLKLHCLPQHEINRLP